MFLGDILKIKAGTLIKGIRMTGVPDSNKAPGSSFMDPDGWSINGMSLAEFDAKSSELRDRIVALTLSPAGALEKVAHELMDTRKITDLTTTTLLVNARVLKNIVMERTNFKACRQGDLVGMSLGETIVAFQPEAPENYRKGYATVMCFHKMLIREKVYWLRTMSAARVNFYNEQAMQEVAGKLMMEMI